MEQDMYLCGPCASPSRTDEFNRDLERDTHSTHGHENGKLVGDSVVRI
jgi:hypothetical protein